MSVERKYSDVSSGAAFVALSEFSRHILAERSHIEHKIEGAIPSSVVELVSALNAQPEVLKAAYHVASLIGQISVIIHAIGIMVCLPRLLTGGEVVEKVSLGAGNTGKAFDLETNKRIAEFTFSKWKRRANVGRQDKLFKDFYNLAEHETCKSRYLYVRGTEMPISFLNGKRSIASVLCKNVTLSDEFTRKYPEYHVVSEYYLPRRHMVTIVDVRDLTNCEGDIVGCDS